MTAQDMQSNIDAIVGEHGERLEHISGAKIVGADEMDEATARAAPRTADIVDLGEWDTASAASYALINEAIVAQKRSPPGFSAEIRAEGAKGPVEGKVDDGVFGPWKLDATDGAGGDIYLTVPIASGKLTAMDIGTGKMTTTDVRPCAASARVQAEFLPHDDEPKKSDLRIAKSEDGVSVESIEPTDAVPDTMRRGVFESVLKQYMNDNLHAFGAVLATVDIGADYDEAKVPWSRPSYTGYAVNRPARGTEEDAVLGVLTLLDGAQAPSVMTYSVPYNALPDGADAAFVLSRRKFLEHMMLPAMPTLFGGDAKPESFEINNEGTQIQNTTALMLRDVKLSDDDVIDLAVSAHGFTLSIEGDQLKVSIEDATFDLSDTHWYDVGLEGHLTYETSYTVELLDKCVALSEKVSKATLSSTKKGWLLGVEIGLAAVTILASFVGAGVAAAPKLVRFLGVAEAAADGAATGAAVVGATTAPVRAGGVLADGAGYASALAGASQAGEAVSLTTKIGRVLKVAAALTPGVMIGAMTGGLFIRDALTASDIQDQSADVTDEMVKAIRGTVVWPEQIGHLELSSVALNGSLVFGFKKKTADA